MGRGKMFCYVVVALMVLGCHGEIDNFSGEESLKSASVQTIRFETYDVHQMLGEGMDEASVKSEYAMCKSNTGMCANAQLACPAACIDSYGGGYGTSGYGGGGYGGYKGGYSGGYRKGYGGYGGRGYGGYGGSRGYGGYGGSRGYGYGGRGYGGYGKNYGGGYGRGYSGYGGKYGGSAGWPSACKYDCTQSCQASCST